MTKGDVLSTAQTWFMDPWADPTLAGRYVARARRLTDLSQRALAQAAQVSASQVGHYESGYRQPSLATLARLLAVAGLTLAVVDESGKRVEPIPHDTVRDRAARRFPSHHDVAPGDEVPWWIFAADPHRAWHPEPASVPVGIRGWRRDHRRLHDGSGPLDDHPTQEELAAHVEQVRATARARSDARRREGPTLPTRLTDEPCTCPDACFETTCLEECPCHCESGQ